MRSISLTLCSVAVVAATLTPSPAALAESGPGAGSSTGTGSGSSTGTGSGTSSGTGSDPDRGAGSRSSLSVTPPSAAPGGEITLRLDGCEGEGATGSSDALASEARFASASDGGLVARARIGSDASPGDHEIRAVCADGTGGRISGTVTVVDRDAATPLAPVRAGGGGTAALTDQEARQSGPGAAHAMFGLALAAVAIVAVAFRGTARRRRPAAD
ncbi:hypothetical protein [Streptomyces sp. NPDC014734]|uniref:hypothetical protein n=1 Tax=Streptomyces sp. NPDC014734 TaxID=3364886 RepID=UPI0036FD36D8